MSCPHGVLICGSPRPPHVACLRIASALAISPPQSSLHREPEDPTGTLDPNLPTCLQRTIAMTSAYDILGVIFGVISLLVFVEHARRFIDARLPPGRLHTIHGALTGACLLIERFERIGCFRGADAAGAYRRRVDE